VYVATTNERHELPFNLNIRGTKWGNLLRTPQKGLEEVVPGRPYAPSESIALNSTIDDRGGTLDFDLISLTASIVQDPWSGVREADLTGEQYRGAYRVRLDIPDNAIVEFRSMASTSPHGAPESRLFLGFIESMESRQQPGGQGTITSVHCVSTNALLDRIIVRKAIPKNRRGQAAGRFTVRSGTDRYQIQQILRYAGAKRSVGDLLLFNPRDFREISKTATALPKLEVAVGTLREALEQVLESAQAKDGIRRNIHINPVTGALHYGPMRDSNPSYNPYTAVFVGDGYDLGYGSAPYSISDNPAYVSPPCGSTKNDYELLLGMRPEIAYGLGDPDPRILEGGLPNSKKYRSHYMNRGSARSGHLYANGVKDTFPAAANNFNYVRAKNATFAHTDERTLAVRIDAGYAGPSIASAYGAYFELGGVNGIIIESEPATSSPNALTLTFDGVAYDLTDRPAQTIPLGLRDYILFRYNPATEAIKIVVNNSVMVDTTQTAPTSSLTDALRVYGWDTKFPGSGARDDATIGLLGWWTRALSDTELDDLWPANFPDRSAQSLTARDLIISSDHSRVVKAAVFLAADSRADRDTDPDPYVRRYNQPGVATGNQPTGNGSYTDPRRPGVHFEAVIDAATVRSGTPAQRSNKITRLARAYFRARSAPQLGGGFSIRGAGAGAGQEYGFAGGWGDHLAVPAGNMTSPSGETNTRFSVTGYRTWRAGQIVFIDTALISGFFTISSVTMSFEPGSFIRRFDVEFGEALPRSIAQLLAVE
jgi:hypothetical protein